MIPDIP